MHLFSPPVKIVDHLHRRRTTLVVSMPNLRMAQEVEKQAFLCDATVASMDAIQYPDKSGHIQTETYLLWGLATCHAISMSNDGLVGNQVEVQMFSSTGWRLIESSGRPPRVEHPNDAQQQLTIVRVNEFEHARRTMSVVALDERTGELHVFCKVRYVPLPLPDSALPLPESVLPLPESALPLPDSALPLPDSALPVSVLPLQS